MNYIISIIKQINPLISGQKNSKGAFIIQKGLAFFLIYAIASLVMEGIIIIVFYAAGYDMLHGQMPTGEFIKLVPLFGFIGFTLFTVLYVKLVEKSEVSVMMLSFRGKGLAIYFGGLFAGGILVGLIILALTLTGAYHFLGFGSFQLDTLLLAFAAYLIQSFAEELMCRGFLQNVLAKRIGIPGAIAASAVAFSVPHISTIVTFDHNIAIVAIINLLLVSVLFSLVMIQWQSVLAACGLHAGWNFVLNQVLGLSVSGGEEADGVFRLMVNDQASWLTGGAYGIEAGAALLPVLLVLDFAMMILIRRRKADGIRKQTI